LAADTDGFLGWAVGAAGDINGDGISDLVIGAFGARPLDRGSAGAAYVIYGKSFGNKFSDINLESNIVDAKIGFKVTWTYNVKFSY